MKKSGKIPVWAIVLIVIAVAIPFLFAVIFVISILGYYYFSSDYINSPFYLNSWNVSSNGVFIDIRNDGGGNCTIKNIEIYGCGKISSQAILSPGETKQMSIPCMLKRGENFRGSIVITYSIEDSIIELNSSGWLTEIVK